MRLNLKSCSVSLTLAMILCSVLVVSASADEATARTSSKSRETSQQLTSRLIQEMHLRHTDPMQMPKPFKPGDAVMMNRTPFLYEPKANILTLEATSRQTRQWINQSATQSASSKCVCHGG